MRTFEEVSLVSRSRVVESSSNTQIHKDFYLYGIVNGRVFWATLLTCVQYKIKGGRQGRITQYVKWVLAKVLVSTSTRRQRRLEVCPRLVSSPLRSYTHSLDFQGGN